MRYPEYVCPVHVHERRLCGTLCAPKRRALTRLARDYRQLWYDRRRGVQAAPPQYVFHVFHDRRPVLKAWGVA